MAWSILRCDEVDSTNNVCKTLAAQGADDTAVIARRQTAGKGRLGRSFRSPEGGLYLSVLWRGCPAEQLLTVTPLAAVAVCRAIEQTCGAVCGIKWCNDVVLNGKKLCGILTESSLRPDGGAEWLVVGIGVNVGADGLSAGYRGTWPPPLPCRGTACPRTRWRRCCWSS